SETSKVMFTGQRHGNLYALNLDELFDQKINCFTALENDAWLWHRRLAHINMDVLSKLSKNELVKGLPKLKFEKDKMCDACQKGKQIKISFKSKKSVTTTRPLELLHMDLCGPIQPATLGGKSYMFVIVDDYSRFTWVMFLPTKDETFEEFSNFCKRVQLKKG
ncbi:hypothetical protein DVA76_17640, partial [Acinetobacter baumannii]